MKKAFTLIELLVVIAIIAILAAILFPVFAQAKAAAKRTQALSNAKQLALGATMYQNDVDDTFMPIQTWRSPDSPASVSGVNTAPWTWIVLPYMKNTQIFLDPQAPAGPAWPAGWSQNAVNALQTQFGYNYANLAPMRQETGAAATQWPSGISVNPVTSTAIANPADTVMLGGKHSRSEVRNLSTVTGFYWLGPGTFNFELSVHAPYCDPAPAVVCGDYWGTTSFSNTVLGNNEQAGAYTGSVSMRGNGQMTISWVDGHVSSKPWGAMVKGTNFARTGTAWPNGASGFSIVAAQKADYVWDIE